MDFKKYFKNKKLKDVLTQHLTAREIEVIGLIATGAETKDIAKNLFIATCTVKAHLKNFKQKLKVKTTPTNFRVAAANFYWTYYKDLTAGVELCKK